MDRGVSEPSKVIAARWPPTDLPRPRYQAFWKSENLTRTGMGNAFEEQSPLKYTGLVEFTTKPA